MLEKLIAINNELGLIKTLDDIEFVFVFYKMDATLSLQQQIDKSLEWAYNNDNLGDFFSEYSDELFNTDLLMLVAECWMSTQVYGTSFHLNLFKSKNRYYCLVDRSPDPGDAYWEEPIYSVDANSHDLKSIVSEFEAECYSVHSCHGDLSVEELDAAGWSFEFTSYLEC